MAAIDKLQRYWQQWGDKLEPLVKGKGARLDFPAKLRRLGGTEKSDVFAPTRPICITNAPNKASTKFRNSHRLAIFINGDLEISKDPDDPCINHRCNITIFKYTEMPGVSVHLEMLDAMHFDVDATDKKTGKRTHFHPIFHVQRGLSLDDETCRDTLADILHMSPDAITVDQSNKAALGTPYLRIPTPQLDMFSVLTLVAADYFCNPGDAIRDEKHDEAAANGDHKAKYAHRSNAKALFVELLNLLRNSSNIAREGVSSVELRDRLTSAGLLSTACWYPESA